MADSYRTNERRYWDERIRRMDRYTSIGQQSLPGSINRIRKEGLFGTIDAVLESREVDPSDSRVLDAGCGTGVYSDFYASRGARVTGVDLSHEALRSARRYGVPMDSCVASLSGLPFSDGRFDVVHTFSVLYHIVDDAQWKASVGELCRVVRRGGILLMRIAWVDHTVRVSDHVKHRNKEEYLEVIVDEKGLELDGVHHIRDVVRYGPLFAIFHRILPRRVSERMGRIVQRFDLLVENADQKVVVFKKP